MGTRIVRMTDTLLQEMLTEGWGVGDDGYCVRCTNGLPDGAKLVDAGVTIYGTHSSELLLKFEHPDFEPPPEGEPIPYLTIEWKRELIKDARC